MAITVKVDEGLGWYSENVEKPDDRIPAINRVKKVMANGLATLLDIVTASEYDMIGPKPTLRARIE